MKGAMGPSFRQRIYIGDDVWADIWDEVFPGGVRGGGERREEKGREQKYVDM